MNTYVLVTPKIVLPGIVNKDDLGSFNALPFTALKIQPGYVGRLIYLRADLVTGITAGNRQLVVLVKDPYSNVVAAFPSGINQGPSTTVVYTYCATNGLGALSGANYQTVSFADVLLYDNYRVDVDVIGFAAGDLVNNVRVVYELIDVSPYGLNTGMVIERSEATRAE